MVVVIDDDGNIIGVIIVMCLVSFLNMLKDLFNVGVFYEIDFYSVCLNYNYCFEYFIV